MFADIQARLSARNQILSWCKWRWLSWTQGREAVLYQLSIWPWELFRSFRSCFSKCQIIRDSTGLIRRRAESPRQSPGRPPLLWLPRSSVLLAAPSTRSLFGKLINNDLEEKWFQITKLFQEQVKVPAYSKADRSVRAGTLWGMCFVSSMWQTYCSKFTVVPWLLPFPKPCH